MILKLANDYGNVEIKKGVPKGYVHVRGQRLQPLCRKLKIRFAPAVVGFTKSGRYWRPQTDGVVVSTRAAAKLHAEIAAREARNPPRAREARAAKAKTLAEQRAERWRERCASLGIHDPDGRTARWLRRDDIDDDEAALIAAKTAYRHEETDYDDVIRSSGDRDFARNAAAERARPTTWDAYLQWYDTPYPEVAEALARILKSPANAHPVWFVEAVIAVKRAGLDLTALTYETVRQAIERWRDERHQDDMP